MSVLLHIAERLLGRPLLVHPDKVPFILAVLEGRLPIVGDVAPLVRVAETNLLELPEPARELIAKGTPSASRFVGNALDSDPETGSVKGLPYKRHDGVAIIPVLGGLVNRGLNLQRSSTGPQSYEAIKYQLQAVANDSRAHAVILDIESPGGEAVGAFELAAAVRDLAARKPVTAVINGMAASAAYAIASGATEIVTTPTGVSGSIGVVLLHADYSRQLDREGITPTLIFAGAHKVDGNPFEPLPADVRADLQAEVNGFYDQFVDTVAKGRRLMTPDRIRGTEARTFVGAEAVRAGLADRLGTFEEVLAKLTARARAAGPSQTTRSASMSDNNGAPAADSPAGTVTRAEHEAGIAAARAQGAEAERMRLAAILGAEGVRGDAARMVAAMELATQSPGMAAEAVTGFVTKNVAAGAAARVDYPQRRLEAQALALPGPGAQGGKTASLDPRDIYASRRSAQSH
ncbi:S49 family peptidase [Salinarimonas sp.]|uniref:S49 family peptidase n=1 Tax=Salinarimonas sp. TaxID=2766526 RepID=UPI00391D3AFD